VPEEGKPQSWFQTLPGILTAIGATLSAITGLILALNQTGLLGGSKATPAPSTAVAAATIVTTPVRSEPPPLSGARPIPVEPRTAVPGPHVHLAGLWSGPIIDSPGNRVERTFLFRRLEDGSFTVEAIDGDCVTRPCIGRLNLAGGNEMPGIDHFRARAEITIYKTATDLGIMYYAFGRNPGDPPGTLTARMEAKYWRNGLPHQHSNESTLRLTHRAVSGGRPLTAKEPRAN
jgi:hypothetical protein